MITLPSSGWDELKQTKIKLEISLLQEEMKMSLVLCDIKSLSKVHKAALFLQGEL